MKQPTEGDIMWSTREEDGATVTEATITLPDGRAVSAFFQEPDPTGHCRRLAERTVVSNARRMRNDTVTDADANSLIRSTIAARPEHGACRNAIVFDPEGCESQAWIRECVRRAYLRGRAGLPCGIYEEVKP